MAVTLASDMKIYELEVAGAIVEDLAVNLDMFNAATNNSIRLFSDQIPGYYRKRAFNKTISSNVARLDESSTSAQTPSKVSQDEIVGVKVLRKWKPVDYTLTAMALSGISPSEFSRNIGADMAQQMREDMIDTAITSVEAALLNQSDVFTDYSFDSGANKDFDETVFTDMVMSLGVRANNLKCWVMHTTPLGELTADRLVTYKFDSVAGALIIKGLDGVPGARGLPIVQSDSTSLYTTVSSSRDYTTLGLVENAVNIIQTGPIRLLVDDVSGGEQIIKRVQAEWDYIVELKGFKWDIDNGSSNPTAATLGTGSNWDLAVTSIKNGPGVVCQTNTVIAT